MTNIHITWWADNKTFSRHIASTSTVTICLHKTLHTRHKHSFPLSSTREHSNKQDGARKPSENSNADGHARYINRKKMKIKTIGSCARIYIPARTADNSRLLLKSSKPGASPITKTPGFQWKPCSEKLHIGLNHQRSLRNCCNLRTQEFFYFTHTGMQPQCLGTVAQKKGDLNFNTTMAGYPL